MQQESATAKARGLRLNQSEHHLHGDCGIYCATAITQNLLARLCRQRICRHRHETLCAHQRLGHFGCGCFRCGIGCLWLACHKRGQWREQNQGDKSLFQC